MVYDGTSQDDLATLETFLDVFEQDLKKDV